MRRAAWVRILALLLSLPAAGSALIVLTVPPVSRMLPAALVTLLRPAAGVMFDMIGMLPPDSIPGRAFYGSYAPLPAIFGPAALAAHAALLALPWLLVSAALLGWSCHTSRRASADQPRPF